MNLELIISISFVLSILFQSIVVLKNIKSSKINGRKETLNIFFKFISNSFIYISILLILNQASTGINLQEIINFNNLNNLNFLHFTVILTLLIDLSIIIILLKELFSTVKDKKKESNLETSKIINQQKAKTI